MKLRRSIAVLGSLSLASAMFASAPSAQAVATLRVGVAYDTGGPGDHSYDDAVAKGLAMAQKRFQFDVNATVTVGSDSDRESRLRSLVAKASNPIIAVGSGYAPAVKIVALDNPNIQFVLVNDASVSALNVTSLVFSESQSGYLAGVTAGLATSTGKIGLVGTQTSQYAEGFTTGARDVKKDITVETRSGNSSSSVLTASLISGGADVIFLASSGSASGVLSTVVNANKRGIKVGLILIEPDQYVSLGLGARKFILASVVKRVDRAIVDVISESSSGRTVIDILNASSGIYGRRYGMQNGGIELSLWSSRVSKYRNVINSAAAKALKLAL